MLLGVTPPRIPRGRGPMSPNFWDPRPTPKWFGLERQNLVGPTITQVGNHVFLRRQPLLIQRGKGVRPSVTIFFFGGGNSYKRAHNQICMVIKLDVKQISIHVRLRMLTRDPFPVANLLVSNSSTTTFI